ncbi:MAG TPA: hypothetical protein VHE77_04275 [Dongiaceae bacterium]|jgi:hypothetical protein|nr:hypothetical protein [Dongiaceae bacterium]
MLRLKLMLAKEQKVNYDVLQMGRDFLPSATRSSGGFACRAPRRLTSQ